MKLIFEKSMPGAYTAILPGSRDKKEMPADGNGLTISPADGNGLTVSPADCNSFSIPPTLPGGYGRKLPPALPELPESEVSRHYSMLARNVFGVNSGFYPLGSCTMKYNPAMCEEAANRTGFTGMHPLQPERTAQGCLEVLYAAERGLCEITGMDAMCFAPAAGAHGELTGLMMIRAYHASRGESNRNDIIVPDSAHGTNPASAHMAGFNVIHLPTARDGEIDIDKLYSLIGGNTAGLMLTNPNTLGLFERRAAEAARAVHDAGGLMYYDGANMNAIMGVTRPGDMGFDVLHLNLHKTFATPHGGGGPGSGPVGCKAALAPFLPVGRVIKRNSDGSAGESMGVRAGELMGVRTDESARGQAEDYASHGNSSHGNSSYGNFSYGNSSREHSYCEYAWEESTPGSIGRVSQFHGNFLVVVRALTYLTALGAEGIAGVSENAVLNANYMLKMLEGKYEAAYPGGCMHEFVLSLDKLKKETGVSALDVAKAMIDRGMHPPTMYFPMIVHEALMFEPTETETKETLDNAVSALLDIYRQAETDPEPLFEAPSTTPVSRPDEAAAARSLKLRYEFK